MTTNAFHSGVSICSHHFGGPYQQFTLPQISTSVLCQPFSYIQPVKFKVLILPWPSITLVLFLELVSQNNLSEYTLPFSLVDFSSVLFFFFFCTTWYPFDSAWRQQIKRWHKCLKPKTWIYFQLLGNCSLSDYICLELIRAGLFAKERWVRNTGMPGPWGQTSTHSSVSQTQRLQQSPARSPGCKTTSENWSRSGITLRRPKLGSVLTASSNRLKSGSKSSITK